MTCLECDKLVSLVSLPILDSYCFEHLLIGLSPILIYLSVIAGVLGLSGWVVFAILFSDGFSFVASEDLSMDLLAFGIDRFI